jgi:hypothetical protein
MSFELTELKELTIILAYGGSQFTPRNNIKLLRRFPLISHTLVVVYQLKLLNKTIVRLMMR